MATADYRLCDKCGCKAFYDSNLNYDFDRNDWEGKPRTDGDRARIEGETTGYTLDYLGDWAVLCNDCAKTHKTIIVSLNP